ncbi:hypothetical protein CHS0354_038743 [Potamilus streckersoni]|uniref:Uncharacterized protein n=1 Tax=Potamilus streckersoni TaxID=2493646 RepID=A0AAE0SQY8_9BIVA|nr:hypothetical protein CHS0354_038743 [Potamilus streckersoni]
MNTVFHELSSNKTGAAVLKTSKERSDENYYNKRVWGRDQFEENKTPRRSDNLWISEDKRKGTAKEEKIKDKNISSTRSNKIRAIKDLRVIYDEGGRIKRFVHSRFMNVGDSYNRYPSNMSPGTKYQNTIEVLIDTS